MPETFFDVLLDSEAEILSQFIFCSRASFVMNTVHQGSFIEVQCDIDADDAKYFT